MFESVFGTVDVICCSSQSDSVRSTTTVALPDSSARRLTGLLDSILTTSISLSSSAEANRTSCTTGEGLLLLSSPR